MMTNRLNSWTRRLWLLLVLGLLSVSLFWAVAQPQMGGKAKGVEKPIYDSQNRLSAVLYFGEVLPKGGPLLEIAGLRVEMFEYGSGAKATNLTVIAPHCFYDQNLKVATSDKTVTAVNGDGKIKLAGVGFKFDQNAAKIVVSNRVRIEIDRELFDKKEAK
jgi:hypothetical protein